MRHISRFEPDEELILTPRAAAPPPLHHRRRAELWPSLLFAGGSIAAFVVLVGCVFAAMVLYYRWH